MIFQVFKTWKPVKTVDEQLLCEYHGYSQIHRSLQIPPFLINRELFSSNEHNPLETTHYKNQNLRDTTGFIPGVVYFTPFPLSIRTPLLLPVAYYIPTSRIFVGYGP